MTPRPLHRWKSFWLGLLVLAFIGWAWRDSFRYESQFWVDGLGKSIWLIRSGGQTFYVFEGGLPQAFDTGASREPLVLTGSSQNATDNFSIEGPHVPDAPIFTVLALVWLALLAWRWRKQRTLTKAHDPATAP